MLGLILPQLSHVSFFIALYNKEILPLHFSVSNKKITSWTIVLAGGERRKSEEGVATFVVRVEKSLAIWAAVLQGIVTCLLGKLVVVAIALCCLQGVLKVVDVSPRELCCYVAGRTAEDRIDKVFLLKEHALVVRTFPSVVEWEDAREFLRSKAGALGLSAHSVIVVCGIERKLWSSAFFAGLILICLIRHSILLCDPGKVTG